MEITVSELAKELRLSRVVIHKRIRHLKLTPSTTGLKNKVMLSQKEADQIRAYNVAPGRPVRNK